MSALVLACAGHALVDLPLFGGPVLFVGGFVFFMSRRARGWDDEELLLADEPEVAGDLRPSAMVHA